MTLVYLKRTIRVYLNGVRWWSMPWESRSEWSGLHFSWRLYLVAHQRRFRLNLNKLKILFTFYYIYKITWILNKFKRINLETPPPLWPPHVRSSFMAWMVESIYALACVRNVPYENVQGALRRPLPHHHTRSSCVVMVGELGLPSPGRRFLVRRLQSFGEAFEGRDQRC
jgi:hypothetical protein